MTTNGCTQVRSGRLCGIDVARALAMIGMLMVHVGPTRLETLGAQWYALPHGRASVLFMLVAGVGVSLLAGSRRVATDGLAVTLLWRALLLLPLGLALQAMQDELNVILQTYALLFLFSLGLVRMRTSLLLFVGLLFLLLGPPAYLYGQIADADRFLREPVVWTGSVAALLHGLLLSGPYPLITWLVPFVVGLWLGRCNLHSTGTRLRLLLAGLAVALLAWGGHVAAGAVWGDPGMLPSWSDPALLTDMAPHSQRPLWLLNATGVAVVVLVLSLVGTDFLQRHARRLIWPLVATGQLALTFYVLHLLMIAWGRETLVFKQDLPPALVVSVVATAAFMTFAVLWRRFFLRGPLEGLLLLPWSAAPRWRRRSSAREAGAGGG